jgi:hypothetical protein
VLSSQGAGVFFGDKFMKSYSEKLKDVRWQKKRLQVLERDEWRCRDCGCEDKTLHVHHCHYEKGGPWETADELLLSLCKDCHERRHAIEACIKRSMGQIMARCPDVQALAVSLDALVEEADDEPVSVFYCTDDLLDNYQLGARDARMEAAS